MELAALVMPRVNEVQVRVSIGFYSCFLSWICCKTMLGSRASFAYLENAITPFQKSV